MAFDPPHFQRWFIPQERGPFILHVRCIVQSSGMFANGVVHREGIEVKVGHLHVPLARVPYLLNDDRHAYARQC